MNGFKKNKNGTTKRTVRIEENNAILENASKEYKPENYLNDKIKKKSK